MSQSTMTPTPNYSKETSPPKKKASWIKNLWMTHWPSEDWSVNDFGLLSIVDYRLAVSIPAIATSITNHSGTYEILLMDYVCSLLCMFICLSTLIHVKMSRTPVIYIISGLFMSFYLIVPMAARLAILLNIILILIDLAQILTEVLRMKALNSAAVSSFGANNSHEKHSQFVPLNRNSAANPAANPSYAPAPPSSKKKNFFGK